MNIFLIVASPAQLHIHLMNIVAETEPGTVWETRRRRKIDCYSVNTSPFIFNRWNLSQACIIRNKPIFSGQPWLWPSIFINITKNWYPYSGK